jgi:hypothetical protein
LAINALYRSGNGSWMINSSYFSETTQLSTIRVYRSSLWNKANPWMIPIDFSLESTKVTRMATSNSPQPC